jgi:hypothetical protein
LRLVDTLGLTIRIDKKACVTKVIQSGGPARPDSLTSLPLA